MSRASIPVDMDLLKECIAEVEIAGPLTKQSALFEAVALLMITRGHSPIQPHIVRLRVEAFKIEVKTKKARNVGAKAEKENTEEIVEETNETVSNFTPFVHPPSRPQAKRGDFSFVPIGTGFKTIAEKAMRGNLQAAIDWKCGECVGWDAEEVRLCVCDSCPLWQFRSCLAK